MHEAVLLRQRGRIIHGEIDLARLHPRDGKAKRAHRLLAAERVGGDAAEVRIFRLEARHSLTPSPARAP
jgi:hypothetical protein